MDKAQIRALVRQHRPMGSSTGYPEHVRRTVADFAQQQRQLGRTWAQLAKTVGISTTSLRSWCGQFARFLPVMVTEEEPPPRVEEPMGSGSTSLSLSTPEGYTVCGLDMPQVLLLLKALR